MHPHCNSKTAVCRRLPHPAQTAQSGTLPLGKREKSPDLIAGYDSSKSGILVALSDGQIIDVPLDEGVSATKTLDLSYCDEAAAFFR